MGELRRPVVRVRKRGATSTTAPAHSDSRASDPLHTVATPPPRRGNRRRRRLFVTTNTELTAMAAPASIGLSRPAAASGRARQL